MTKNQEELITRWFDEAEDKIEFLNGLRTFVSSLSPQKSQPVDRVLWVPVDMVQANDYNPNPSSKTRHNESHSNQRSIETRIKTTNCSFKEC